VQLRAASRFIENDLFRAGSPDLLIRLCWQSWCGSSNAAISSIVRKWSPALEALLLARQLSIEHPEDVRAAIRDYMNGEDFADGLIAAWNARLGCEIHRGRLTRRAARTQRVSSH